MNFLEIGDPRIPTYEFPISLNSTTELILDLVVLTNIVLITYLILSSIDTNNETTEPRK
jgi:hypothetical protein